MPSVLLIDLYLTRHPVDLCRPAHGTCQRDEEDITRVGISFLTLPHPDRLNGIGQRVVAIIYLDGSDAPLA